MKKPEEYFDERIGGADLVFREAAIDAIRDAMRDVIQECLRITEEHEHVDGGCCPEFCGDEIERELKNIIL